MDERNRIELKQMLTETGSPVLKAKEKDGANGSPSISPNIGDKGGTSNANSNGNGAQDREAAYFPPKLSETMANGNGTTNSKEGVDSGTDEV